MPPVQIGGQRVTSHFVPALLPPQRRTTNSRLAAMDALCFEGGTQLPDSICCGCRCLPRIAKLTDS